MAGIDATSFSFSLCLQLLVVFVCQLEFKQELKLGTKALYVFKNIPFTVVVSSLNVQPFLRGRTDVKDDYTRTEKPNEQRQFNDNHWCF